MRKILAALIVLGMMSSAHAFIRIKCSGIDGGNVTQNIIVDPKSFMRNGGLIKTDSYRKGKEYYFVFSENFYNSDHDYVYEAIIEGRTGTKDAGNFYYAQYWAKTNKLKTILPVSCFEDDF